MERAWSEEGGEKGWKGNEGRGGGKDSYVSYRFSDEYSNIGEEEKVVEGLKISLSSVKIYFF